jgi:mannosyltransferase
MDTFVPWTNSKQRLPMFEPGNRQRSIRWLDRRRILRLILRHWRLILSLVLAFSLESWLHTRSFKFSTPKTNLDPPFYTTCQNPVRNNTGRVNATMVMMARNSDVEGAVASVLNIQQQFNRNFGYPWVFLNNEPWSKEFIAKATKAVSQDGSGATAKFETIPANMWGYPSWVDKSKSQHNMKVLESKGIKYAGKEDYHHMCRFSSGLVPLPELRFDVYGP